MAGNDWLLADAEFQIRQCLRGECRFRFPTAVNSGEGKYCPRCNAPTREVGQSFAGHNDVRVVGNEPRVPVVALLDNLRSSYNVGSIFRTCDGAGVEHVHLCGISSTPEQTKVRKTALGADRFLPWSYYRNGVEAVKSLKKLGYRIWSLENREPSQSIFALDGDVISAPIVLVVGNELSGVDPGIIELSDRIVSVPMTGLKKSLNVVVAFGVAAYWLRFAGSQPTGSS